MRVVNKSKDVLVAQECKECVTTWEQVRGMMFRQKVVPLIFRFSKEQIVGFHSWFCPGAMDLVFLNEEWEVVEVKSEFEPRDTYRNRRPAQFVLELPSGTVRRTRTEVGDILHILK